MLYKYETAEDSPFVGSIEIAIPPYTVRSKLLTEYDLMNEDKMIENMLSLYEKEVIDRVKSVNLFIGDLPVGDLEALGYYKEGAAIIQDLCKLVLEGVPISGK